MKLRLLNSGIYGTLSTFDGEFPVEVEGYPLEDREGVYMVSARELRRVGFENACMSDYPFKVCAEIEVVGTPEKKLVGFKIKDCDGDWFLDFGYGVTENKTVACIYPVDFMSTIHPYQKGHGDVLVPVYK